MAGTCFVIMPFSVSGEQAERYPPNHWDEVYQSLISKAVKKADLICHRDDDDSASRHITTELWKKIENASIVLCDLSAYNPNVFLELGWAMRADKPFVLIKDDLTAFPFDLGQHNMFVYNKDLRPLALQQQVRMLAKMLEDTLHDSERKYSLVRPLNLTAERTRICADIYYHKKGLTRRDAQGIAESLRIHGVDSQIREHDDLDGPDSIFFGSMIDVKTARLVAGFVPYTIKYLFRPDYPESEGGDNRGYKIGIGYSSQYNEARRIKRAEPVPISPKRLASLLHPDQTNASFHRMLWETTLGV